MASEQGVTLMETMVYVAMAGMLLAVAVTAFLGQNKSYNRQDVIAEVQQNIRAGFEMMASDIRLANYDPDAFDKEPFAEAENETIAMNVVDDVTGDDLTVHYMRTATNELQRAVVDKGTTPVAADYTKIAENIEEIRFEYLFDKDPDIDADEWVWARNVASIITEHESLPDPSFSAEENDDAAKSIIKAVKIVILGGSREAAFNPTDYSTYNPPLEDPTAADDPNGDGIVEWVPVAGTGYKRMMSMTAQCRNNRGV